MPFADDVRKYNFAPLEYLTNKRGDRVTKHPYIPTEDQLDAMDNFVDALDLMNAGEKNEAGYVLLLEFNHILDISLGHLAKGNRGLIRGYRITLLYIARSKRYSIAQSFQTLRHTLYPHLTPNSSNTSRHPNVFLRRLGQPSRNARPRSM